jgi:hypothetical protein
MSLGMRWPGGHHRQAAKPAAAGAAPRVSCRFWSAVASKDSTRQPTAEEGAYVRRRGDLHRCLPREATSVPG